MTIHSPELSAAYEQIARLKYDLRAMRAERDTYKESLGAALRENADLRAKAEEPAPHPDASAKSPGELVKVGDRVRFKWNYGEKVGIVDHANGAWLKVTARAVHRLQILEILPPEAP